MSNILTERYEDAGDFFGLRQQYRHEALVALRKREGIPAPELVDGRWMYRGADGKFHCQATGCRKGPSVEQVDEFWGSDPLDAFTVLPVSESGTPIEKEAADLAKFANEYKIADKVSHGDASEPNPGFDLDGLDDAVVDAAIQEYVKRGEDGNR